MKRLEARAALAAAVAPLRDRRDVDELHPGQGSDDSPRRLGDAADLVQSAGIVVAHLARLEWVRPVELDLALVD